jgi:hypothetical protein
MRWGLLGLHPAHAARHWGLHLRRWIARLGRRTRVQERLSMQAPPPVATLGLCWREMTPHPVPCQVMPKIQFPINRLWNHVRLLIRENLSAFIGIGLTRALIGADYHLEFQSVSVLVMWQTQNIYIYIHTYVCIYIYIRQIQNIYRHYI